MRYSDPPSAYGYDGSLLKHPTVTLDYRSNRLVSLGYPDVRQEYQASMRNPSQVD